MPIIAMAQHDEAKNTLEFWIKCISISSLHSPQVCHLQSFILSQSAPDSQPPVAAVAAASGLDYVTLLLGTLAAGCATGLCGKKERGLNDTSLIGQVLEGPGFQ